MKPDTRKIIEAAIEYARQTHIPAMNRAATMRGMLIAALEVEDKSPVLGTPVIHDVDEFYAKDE